MGILHIGIFWKAKMYENVKPAYLSLSNFIFRYLCQGNTEKSVQRYFYGTRTQKAEKGSPSIEESLTKSIAAQGPCDSVPASQPAPSHSMNRWIQIPHTPVRAEMSTETKLCSHITCRDYRT